MGTSPLESLFLGICIIHFLKMTPFLTPYFGANTDMHNPNTDIRHTTPILWTFKKFCLNFMTLFKLLKYSLTTLNYVYPHLHSKCWNLKLSLIAFSFEIDSSNLEYIIINFENLLVCNSIILL